MASYASAVVISKVLPGRIAIDRGQDGNLTDDDAYRDRKWGGAGGRERGIFEIVRGEKRERRGNLVEVSSKTAIEFSE
jgi:hypothetical protein